MICPKCRDSELKGMVIKATDTALDGCPKCGGVWFDARELETILGMAAKDLRALRGSIMPDMLCPVCARPLAYLYYPQTYVTVDICRKCGGLWLDSGELREIKAVREHVLKRELEEQARASGVKGAMLRFVDSAIEALSFW